MSAASRFGPRLDPGGGVTFRLWAPAAQTVDLVTDQVRPMSWSTHGWFELAIAEARPGTRYRFRIDDDLLVPDPASAFQPDDVHGPSEVIDHRYAWKAKSWRGRPWREAVILEVHVGAFTPEGTYRAAMDKLDHVVETGVTALELMPLADFSGRRNWGYDGALLFAPDSTYGRPEELKALIDAAHQRGLMVFLDVVYNHFGPDGNYLWRYAPEFFSREASTPWGPAIDFDVEEVRAFVIQNALYWLHCYRFDGLRLDAVHAIAKRGNPSILEDLSRAVGNLAAATGRMIHLVVEDDANTASLLDPTAEPHRGKFRAQWNDDYHHAWHVLLTGETNGYYRDYAHDPRADLAKVLGSGFAYQGEPSVHRRGARRGEPSGALPPTAFVSFLQNHDQIGNRPRGERLDVLADGRAIEAALTVTLLGPMPPLLFMGEEWGAAQPFPFFCDFKGKLADAVRKGRQEEFDDVYVQDERGDFPDPLSEHTFRTAVLDWTVRDQPKQRARLRLVRALLEKRCEYVIPHLANLTQWNASAKSDGPLLTATWRLDSGKLHLLANLSDGPAFSPNANPAIAIWGGPPPNILPPWSVFWSWEDA